MKYAPLLEYLVNNLGPNFNILISGYLIDASKTKRYWARMSYNRDLSKVIPKEFKLTEIEIVNGKKFVIDKKLLNENKLDLLNRIKLSFN